MNKYGAISCPKCHSAEVHIFVADKGQLVKIAAADLDEKIEVTYECAECGHEFS